MKIFGEIPCEVPTTELLDKISYPRDLKKLSSSDLKVLADELREFLLYSVGKSGGHLGAGLGVVELTIVLHYLYDAPHDNIIWDVGHQAYPHKILTGRKDQINSIRSKASLAPFPSRNESNFDSFGTGHSSTSISSAVGMSIANKLNQGDKKTVAIIGDGAMTAGMAFEGMQHAGGVKPDMLIILNDNDMSISENVGGLNNYFSRIWASKLYKGIKSNGKKFLKNIPAAHHLARTVETHMKTMVAPGAIFEELGLNYIGPIDGHDVDQLLKVIGNLKNFEGPQFLHIITKKGAGYNLAEEDRIKYHAISKIKTSDSNEKTKPKYQDIFSNWIVDMAKDNVDLVGITPAMREGSGLVEFSKEFPERYFDVAIAEQHAVTLSAGLACQKKKPVVAIYSTFLQRAYDQLIHDVAVQNLDVTFAIDRAGLVGEDGPTHSGNYDLAYLRCIPNMIVMTPSNENETRKLLTTGFLYNGPASIRYPRGSGPNVEVENDLLPVEIGKGRLIKEGSKHLIVLNFGALLDQAKEVANTLDLTLIDMRFVKPLDKDILIKYLSKAQAFVSIEDGSVAGGAGSAVLEFCSDNNINIKSKLFGIPDIFIEHQSREEMIEESGLKASRIIKEIEGLIVV